MVASYHEKDIAMLKLDCTIPILSNLCLQKSTASNVYPSKEAELDLLEKVRIVVVGSLSFVFTHKALIDQIFIRKSEKTCKSMVGIDASQL